MAASEMRDKFAVVGLGVVMGHVVGTDRPYTGRSLQAEAARLAIEDAGLEAKDVDGAIDARREAGPHMRQDWTDAFPRVLGLPAKFYFHVSRGGAPGTWAIMSALPYLQMEAAKYVVVAGAVADWSRSRRRRSEGAASHGMGLGDKDGTWATPFGVTVAIGYHSLLASRHMYEYGTTSRQLGMVAVQIRQWAQLNPLARMHGRPITIEDHQNSPIVVDPLHFLDMCLMSDGAVAVVLTTAERAKDCAKPPVYIMGAGFGEHMERLWWEKANYTQLAVQTAKDQAFKMAGIELKDIDLAELYDCFTPEVIFQLEDYGWCKKGEGGPFVEEGHIGPGGDVPVNTYGGLLSGYHIADLGGIAEAVTQLRGEGGQRQVKDAEICLVTGHGGEVVEPMCSLHTSLILRR